MLFDREGLVPGNDKEGAELEGIRWGLFGLDDDRKIEITISGINHTFIKNKRLDQILTQDGYIRKISPSNTVLDEKQIEIIKQVRKYKHIKAHVW